MYNILGHEEENLYRFVLSHGPLQRATLHAEFGPSVDAAIQHLLDIALVYGEEIITACLPALVLHGVLVQRGGGYVPAEAYLGDFEGLYYANGNERPGSPSRPVETLASEEEVGLAFEKIFRVAKSELMTFLTWPFLSLNDDDSPAVKRESDPDHPTRCRILLEWGLVNDPVAMSRLTHSEEQGCELRTTDKLPFKAALGDGRLALVMKTRSTPSDPLVACLIQPSLMLDNVVRIFETEWNRALPVKHLSSATSAEGLLTDEDMQLLRWWIVDGLKDEAIGARLGQKGLSKRTVGRRFSDLSEKLGVSTRQELAYILGARHLLSDLRRAA